MKIIGFIIWLVCLFGGFYLGMRKVNEAPDFAYAVIGAFVGFFLGLVINMAIFIVWGA